MQIYWLYTLLDTLRLGQNGRHFPDSIFKCIFLNENIWISIYISLKFVPKGPIKNIPALVWKMAWPRPGDKPLSESVKVWLPIHICVTPPKLIHYNDVIMGAIASQITSLTIVYSTVYSGTDQRKHQRSASLAFVRGIHWRPVNSPRKWPVTRKMLTSSF